MRPNINRSGLEFDGPEDELKLDAIRAALAKKALGGRLNEVESSLLHEELSSTDEHTGTFLSAEAAEAVLHLLRGDSTNETISKEMSANLGQLYSDAGWVEQMAQTAIEARQSAQQTITVQNQGIASSQQVLL